MGYRVRFKTRQIIRKNEDNRMNNMAVLYWILENEDDAEIYLDESFEEDT